jgi:hypothetical protein
MFRTFETVLVKAAENLLNKIFCLGLVRQEKACRPRPSLKAAAKGGPARPMQSGADLAAWEHWYHLGPGLKTKLYCPVMSVSQRESSPRRSLSRLERALELLVLETHRSK